MPSRIRALGRWWDGCVAPSVDRTGSREGSSAPTREGRRCGNSSCELAEVLRYGWRELACVLSLPDQLPGPLPPSVQLTHPGSSIDTNFARLDAPDCTQQDYDTMAFDAVY